MRAHVCTYSLTHSLKQTLTHSLKQTRQEWFPGVRLVVSDQRVVYRRELVDPESSGREPASEQLIGAVVLGVASMCVCARRVCLCVCACVRWLCVSQQMVRTVCMRACVCMCVRVRVCMRARAQVCAVYVFRCVTHSSTYPPTHATHPPTPPAWREPKKLISRIESRSSDSRCIR